MNFLAPLFLLGALAIAGPIIFHLIRRTTKDVTPFSTLMFLEPTPPRVTRRSRLENLWLLLLRCLALALLALGFSRPFFPARADPNAPSANAGRRVVLLVDTSASMRRENLWTDAKAKAAAALRDVTPMDHVAVLTFDRATQPVVSFDQWQEARPEERVTLAGQRLEAITPGWSATNLGAALLRASELLDTPDEVPGVRREIVVVSDMQEGAKLDGVQGRDWPRGLIVTLVAVTPKNVENGGMAWLSETEDSTGSAEDAPMRVRVTNAANGKREQFHLAWDGTQSAGLDVQVPIGQSRTVLATKPPVGATRILLTGDDTPFDNTLHIVAPQPVPVPVLFLGNDNPDDPAGALTYLRRAFQRTRQQAIELHPLRGDASVPGFELQQAQLLILGDGTADAAIAAAKQFAYEGKIVLFPLSSADSAAALARLLDIGSVNLQEAKPRDYSMLGKIDFTHPLFAAFADPRYSDFTKIHFWKHRRLDTAKLKDAKVLAHFDDGDAAVVQVPVGKGSVIVLTTTWRPADSQLALSSKFVPLLHAMLDLSSRLPARRAQYFVGDSIPLPPGPQPFTIRKPDNAETTVAAGSTFAATDQPGVYSVAPGTLRLVVNVAPDESRTAPLTPAHLASLGVPLEKSAAQKATETPQDPALAQAAELEARQKVWRWLVIATLGVLLLETLIAAKLSRPKLVQQEAQT